MIPLIILLTAGYLVFLIGEKKANDKALASFRTVIHVNGIRGKTGTCRLIDAHLRGAGLRVFTKTTGSDAAYIGTDGKEVPIRRIAPASIGEQLRMIRLAKKQGAEVLVLECMAVDPALQLVSQQSIVKGSCNVITNVRYDHVFEMGGDKASIAESLSATVPENGILFTQDAEWYPFFREKCEKKGSRCVLCTPADGMDENEAVAVAVGEHLGVSRTDFRKHLEQYLKADFGTKKVYPMESGTFLNLFSVNDPESTQMQLERLLPAAGRAAEKPVFLYNNRSDRPDRLLLFIRYFFPLYPGCTILVTGGARPLAVRKMRQAGLEAVPVRNGREAMALAAGRTLVGIGNIKGEAERMLRALEGGNGNE